MRQLTCFEAVPGQIGELLNVVRNGNQTLNNGGKQALIKKIVL